MPAVWVKLKANDLNCVDVPLKPTHSLNILWASVENLPGVGKASSPFPNFFTDSFFSVGVTDTTVVSLIAETADTTVVSVTNPSLTQCYGHDRRVHNCWHFGHDGRVFLS